MISVVIATMNRSQALTELSLPSLLSQDCNLFEIVIWDASSDDQTEQVAIDFKNKFEKEGISLRYKKAPRRGLPSQRNDAVLAADGDIIFFVDDDCEIHVKAISTIIHYFQSFPWLQGVGIPLINKWPVEERFKSRSLFGQIKSYIHPIFFGTRKYSRQVRNTTGYLPAVIDVPGFAEWLSGGAMAFRKTVFAEVAFDERLERFGGYAWGEDADFSHRVFLHYNQPLLVASGSHIIHHNATGGRTEKRKKTASYYYNSYIIMENFKKYCAKYRLLPFIWEQRIGRTISMMIEGTRFRDIICGFWDYKKAVKNQK